MVPGWVWTVFIKRHKRPVKQQLWSRSHATRRFLVLHSELVPLRLPRRERAWRRPLQRLPRLPGCPVPGLIYPLCFVLLPSSLPERSEGGAENLLGHNPVGARSPDRAPRRTEGLLFVERETFGQTQGRGQETLPQQWGGVRRPCPNSVYGSGDPALTGTGPLVFPPDKTFLSSSRRAGIMLYGIGRGCFPRPYSCPASP